MAVYVKPKELYLEIIKSKEQDTLTPRALEMLMLMAERTSTKLKYRNPSDREDCVASAYVEIWKYWRSFDPAKGSNAFAYYTEIIKKGLAKGWNQLHPKKYAGTISIDAHEDSDGIYTI